MEYWSDGKAVSPPHYSITPLLQYSSIPLLQYSITPFPLRNPPAWTSRYLCRFFAALLTCGVASIILVARAYLPSDGHPPHLPSADRYGVRWLATALSAALQGDIMNRMLMIAILILAVPHEAHRAVPCPPSALHRKARPPEACLRLCRSWFLARPPQHSPSQLCRSLLTSALRNLIRQRTGDIPSDA
jgi:hypothetical protein